MFLLLVVALPACKSSTIVLDGEPGGSDSATDSGLGDSGGDNDTGGPADSGDTGETGDTDIPAPLCFDAGIVVEESAALAYGANVDGYDSTAGAYGGGNIGDGAVAVNSRADCALKVGATIRGTGWVGGDPAGAYCEEYGAAVSGGVHQLAARMNGPKVEVPTGLANAGDLSVGWRESAIIDHDAHYDSIVVAFEGTLTIASTVVLVVESFDIQGGAVVVESGATAEVYMAGPVSMGWGTQANSAGTPDQLQIFVDGDDDVSVAEGATLAGWIVAPESAVSVNGTLYGAVSAETLSSGWGAWLHLDEAAICP